MLLAKVVVLLPLPLRYWLDSLFSRKRRRPWFANCLVVLARRLRTMIVLSRRLFGRRLSVVGPIAIVVWTLGNRRIVRKGRSTTPRRLIHKRLAWMVLWLPNRRGI